MLILMLGLPAIFMPFITMRASGATVLSAVEVSSMALVGSSAGAVLLSCATGLPVMQAAAVLLSACATAAAVCAHKGCNLGCALVAGVPLGCAGK